MLLCSAVHYIDTADGARTAADRMCAVARYNNISLKADCGDIFIVHDQKSSYRTPLFGRNNRPGAPDHKGALALDFKGAGARDPHPFVHATAESYNKLC